MTSDSKVKPVSAAPRRRAAADAHGRRAGATAPPAATGNPQPLKLPHERDESTAVPVGPPTAPMRQAYRDLARGLADTDRGAEVGRTYAKLKR